MHKGHAAQLFAASSNAALSRVMYALPVGQINHVESSVTQPDLLLTCWLQLTNVIIVQSHGEAVNDRMQCAVDVERVMDVDNGLHFTLVS